jgi:hypothetical protein
MWSSASSTVIRFMDIWKYGPFKDCEQVQSSAPNA